MNVHHLDAIFQPRHIAVVGASDEPAKVGGIVLRNLRAGGFSGPLYPINSRRDLVGGLKAWPTLSQLPQVPDLVVVCTPAATVPGLVRECGELGVGGLVVLSAGFRETGAAGRELEAAVRAELDRHPRLRMIGPNCLGVLSTPARVNASFAADSPLPGQIALVSQSGALCTSLLDWALQQQIGFSHFVSIGNSLDVGFGELIDYFAEDPHTKALVLYVESLSAVRGFVSAARLFSRTRPIVAYKAGRYRESAQAASSHTGALAGEDAVVNALFRRAGIERVYDMAALFDCAELLAGHRLPKGPRLAIVTNAGGPGVMAADAVIERGGELARLQEATLAKLSELLPPAWSHANPVDILGDAPAERFGKAVSLVLADEGVDALLVLLTPQSMTDPTETARQVAAAIPAGSKPVLTAWLGGTRVTAGGQLLQAAGFPNYDTPERAVEAFLHLVSFARNRAALDEIPRGVPVGFATTPADRRAATEALGTPEGGILTESDSKQLLSRYEIPVMQVQTARGVAEAVQAASAVGYPVVLKIWSPDITHKTDVGGVRLGLRDAAAVRAAYVELCDSVKLQRPQAQVWGVTVQPMADLASGLELILGMKRDPVCGAVLLVGSGGITAEIAQDRALELPPLNERLARRMLESLRLWPLLNGYRGRPPLDVEALIEVLVRLSYLIAEQPRITELDINPLLVLPHGVLALDARVVMAKPMTVGGRPYAHLAIRPYPDEFGKVARLDDGTDLLLRAIRAEDEPAWLRLLQRCSPETLRARFGGAFKLPNHATAARYCVIDYDRELALVAERQVAGQSELLGVARLVADPQHQAAEFAILVEDAWQSLGVGGVLARHAVACAREWGVKELRGETAANNLRMRGLFAELGFTEQTSDPLQSVAVRRVLNPKD